MPLNTTTACPRSISTTTAALRRKLHEGSLSLGPKAAIKLLKQTFQTRA
jgi:hypothetical protein